MHVQPYLGTDDFFVFDVVVFGWRKGWDNMIEMSESFCADHSKNYNAVILH